METKERGFLRLMMKVSLLSLPLFFGIEVNGATLPLQLTQEQLAQYVAAQQTAAAAQGAPPQRYVTVAAVPRQRVHPSYQPEQRAYRPQEEEPEASQIDTDAYLRQADQQSVIAQQPLVYYRRPQQSVAPQQQKRYKLRLQDDSQAQQPDDYDPNPQYQFSFDIKDDDSTNYHNRKETRDGDKISGSYSVVDSDGYIRTVTYTADPKEGFKADVNRQPTDIVVKLPKHPVAAPQQYQQITAAQAQALARKQQTQQYLEATSSVDNLDPSQYAVKPQPAQVYVQPQQRAPAAYFAPHRLSPAVIGPSGLVAKAPKAYNPNSQSSAAVSGLLYRAYQPQQQ